jgi:hypothetical protein
VLRRNRRADVRVRDPATDEEREAVAQTCALRMRLAIPVLSAGSTLLSPRHMAAGGSAVPRRLRRACGVPREEGPFGFKPPELEAAIRAELGKASRTPSESGVCPL